MNLSVIERFLADTPPFFKKVQGLMVAIIGAIISVITVNPALATNKYLLIAGAVAIAVMIICSFAVKEIPALTNGTPLTVESVTGLLGDVANSIAELKALVANPPKSAADLVVDAAKAGITQATAPADKAVNEPPADNAPA